MIQANPLLPPHEDLVAHFAGRAGGVSLPPYGTLNLGFSTGDDAGRVVENRARLAAHLGAPLQRWVVPGQTHGSRVLRARVDLAGEGARTPSQALPPSDAVYLEEPGIFALSLSADCPLVVVCDSIRRRLGVAHAGWRGTAAGVVEALLEAFLHDGSQPAQLTAALSPGVCGPCYPVGEEVYGALARKTGFERATDGGRLDLRALQEEILLEVGIPPGQIHKNPDCSACTPARFFSYRRDGGQTGRNGALVGWRS